MKKGLIILILLGMVSCVRYDMEEILLQRDGISFTIRGEDQFEYNPLTCQFAHNGDTHEYRVLDDMLSNWVIVKCHERPSGEGQELTADITWTASSSIKTMKDLTFRVEKTDASGNIWMWCRQKKVGIVIKNL